MFMPNNTKQKFSTKVLKEAKEVLRGLQEQTAEMEGALSLLSLMNDGTEGPFDRSIIRECSELITVFNRLMHEQEAKLRHMQMMQIAVSKAEREYGRFRQTCGAQSKNVFKN